MESYLETLLPDSNVFLSLDDAPLDVPPEEEGDDSIHEHDFGMDSMRSLSSASSVSRGIPNKNRVVPLPRTLKRGDTGYDVLALKRALSKAGVRKWDVKTKKFGITLEKNVKTFQKKMKLKQDGVYGVETHKKLKGFFDLYSTNLMVQQQNLLDPRNKIVSTAIFGYNNRGSIHYTQGPMRMYGVKHHIYPPRIPYYEDCSSFSTWCYWVAGVPDPNGLGYNGFGYTGTLAAHGMVVSTARPGDLNFYGAYFPYHHVTVAISSTRCISHGAESGPLLLPIRYRSDFHYTRSYLK